MLSLDQMSPEVARGFSFILTDIDDTLTEEGKLLAEAYDALWQLHKSGLRVIPITGRPAGWCDLIAREWPVEGVVGENGAFAFYEEEGVLRQIFHPSVAGASVRDKLQTVRDAVLREVPLAREAKDQAYRLFDLAIDFREEEPRLDYAVARHIKEICESMGARAKVSSIHVNAWFGDYDKLSMTRLYVRQRWGTDIESARNRVAFCGDSPNDEPMFAFFPESCGVANIADFGGDLSALPRYVARSRGGRGFAEFAQVLLLLRRALP